MARMKIGEIRTLLKGKPLTYYDSFSGSLSGFTIGRAMTGTSSCIRCCSAMNKENFIFVPYIAIEQLVEEGYYEMCGWVENIYVRQIWTLGL